MTKDEMESTIKTFNLKNLFELIRLSHEFEETYGFKDKMEEIRSAAYKEIASR